jgi:hypothetical protein
MVVMYPSRGVGELRITVLCTFAGAAVGLAPGGTEAHADEAASATANTSRIVPPPTDRPLIQWGAALAAEIVASAGPACPDAANASNQPPCILGSGGGIVARGGWRPNANLYLGAAYEVSKQEPHQLYLVALLQQARAEARWYFPTGRDVSPFLLVGAGASAYGSALWPFGGVDTWGPSGSLGAGIEVQLGGPVLVISLAYRPTYLHAWVDSSTLSHDAGVAHFVGLEAAVEAQDNL